MENLVYVKKNTVVCDSLQVAEKFGKNHQHILEAIDKLTVENSTVVEMFHKGTYKADNGHIYRKYLMNRDGFSLLVMGFTGKQAIEWKLQYIEAFNRMETLLLQKQSQIWQDTRKYQKEIRKQETDAIKHLVEYAQEQGSSNAARYYVSLSKLADKAAGITDRDKATMGQLATLTLVENILHRCIMDGIDLEEPYKDIYQDCKQRIEQFRTVAYLG